MNLRWNTKALTIKYWIFISFSQAILSSANPNQKPIIEFTDQDQFIAIFFLTFTNLSYSRIILVFYLVEMSLYLLLIFISMYRRLFDHLLSYHIEKRLWTSYSSGEVEMKFTGHMFVSMLNTKFSNIFIFSRMY